MVLYNSLKEGKKLKIICDNGIYVQKKDIAFVVNNIENVDYLKLININNENIYEFELFSSPKDIEFFSNLDFMLCTTESLKII